ncbi:spondin-2-like isoform X1 [Dendronephthya gigantea]|uniref:spondin-2-like isoform X1 n=1 Tax=Dendronephthya gigantea TaxID=151771 RepID=UPI00106A8204|nr:spondin-2-like isoform X1 [Dendronephthya gigantea]XP_028391289.1 spondin-2-like isoform X1 [Dendronephthya gigantea]
MIPRSFRFNTRMPSLHDVLCLLALFFECVLHAESMPCRGTATYRLQFQGEWKNSSSRPAGAQFTGFIGAVHNKCYQMWETGERASLGVKNVAEEGDYMELSKEIQKHIEKWKTATEQIKPKTNTIGPLGDALLPDTENPQSGYTLDRSHTLVSVVVRVEPSPDWFVGISNINLCNKSGEWVREPLRIQLVPYDAGTAVRSQHNHSLVVPSNPREKIATLDEKGISDLNGIDIAYIRISFQHSFPDASPQHVIDEDNCPNKASIREISLLGWSTLICVLFVFLNFM